MRGQSSIIITGAQKAVGNFCVSGVLIGQKVRARCSCTVVCFPSVSRLQLRGQSAKIITGAQKVVGNLCVSGVPIGQ
jgi:hypothetical protein